MSLIQGLHCDLQIVYSVKVNSVMLDFCNFLLSQSSPSCKSWIKKDKRVSRDSKTGTRSSFAKIIITAHKERALAAVNLQSALRRPEPFKAMKVKVSHAVVSNSLWPQDWSPPGFSVHGIFQARLLEWVAISFFRGSSQPRDRTQVSHIAGKLFND